jgi:GT2 family glycosyltransferase
LGVEVASGKVIIFLNNDTEILTESAIEEMAAWSLVSGIGTVGCNLSSIDGKYGCAGIKARAIPSLKNLTFMAESTDLTYANVVRETYGNSFACTAIARSTYQNLGKLNEVEFFNGYNDVEFLERTHQEGYTNIYLGHLKVNHSPGTSRGRCDELIQSMLLRYQFTQASADSLFQLERDEYLTNELRKLEKKKTQSDTQKFNEEIKKIKLENQKLKTKITKLKVAEIKAKEEINAMKTSKFWQLRTKWFKIKGLFGIADE